MGLFLLFSPGMARLQIHLGPERVRRRDGDLRPVGAHLAPGHHPVQQVSEGQTFQDKRDLTVTPF